MSAYATQRTLNCLATHGGYQEPRCSGTRLISGSAATSTAAARAKSQAWVRPGSWELARIAVSIEIVMIVPIDMDIVLSAARVEACSGASCSPALRLAGLFAPRPAPTRKAEPASHAYGEIPASGARASSSIPAAVT